MPFCMGYVHRDVVDIPFFDHELFAVNGKDRLPFEAGADLFMGVNMDGKPGFGNNKTLLSECGL
jgi:hypothetical protein